MGSPWAHSLSSLSLFLRMWGVAPIMQAGGEGREETQGTTEFNLKNIQIKESSLLIFFSHFFIF